MTNESKVPWWGWLMVLFLVPVGYVLSCFLVAVVADRLGLDYPILVTYYAPPDWAVDEWEWLFGILEPIARQLGLD